jgi:hypothetical protein
MRNTELIKQLTDFKACEDAIQWVRDNKYTLKEAWAKSKRADWLLWYMCRTEMATQKERIHIICDCAATALKYVPKGEDRPRLAIEAARKYADNPTEENRNATYAAANAATDAAYAADAATYAAAYAADAATYAAAYAAAHAATDAAYAADAAHAAAYAAAYAAYPKAHIKMCRMIRRKINVTR